MFRLKRFLDPEELQRPQKSINLVTHVMFWNYIHDVTLLIMQIYDDDIDRGKQSQLLIIRTEAWTGVWLN